MQVSSIRLSVFMSNLTATLNEVETISDILMILDRIIEYGEVECHLQE